MRSQRIESDSNGADNKERAIGYESCRAFLIAGLTGFRFAIWHIVVELPFNCFGVTCSLSSSAKDQIQLCVDNPQAKDFFKRIKITIIVQKGKSIREAEGCN